MKVSYEYTKDEYKKFLLKSRLINNIILFIVGLAIYLYFSYNRISLVYLPLYILVLILIIFGLNMLYVWATFKVNDMLNYNLYGKYILELTPNKFSITINKSKTDYKYNQIRKLVEKKNSFILKLNKSRDSLIFEKNNFSENDYIKTIEMFKDKIKSHR